MCDVVFMVAYQTESLNSHDVLEPVGASNPNLRIILENSKDEQKPQLKC